jgi:hypothetical protein
MKVRIVATGEEKHIPIDGHVAALLRLGIIEELKENVAPPPRGTAKWGLTGINEGDVKELTITSRCDVCSQTLRGNPKPTVEAVSQMIFWHCGRGEKVPSEISTAYIQAGGGTPPVCSLPVNQWGGKPDGGHIGAFKEVTKL